MSAEIKSQSRSPRKYLENQVVQKKNETWVQAVRDSEDNIEIINDTRQLFEIKPFKRLLEDMDSEIDDDGLNLTDDELDASVVTDFSPTVYLGEYARQENYLLSSNKVVNHLRRFSDHKQDKQYTLHNKKDQLMAELCRNQFIDTTLGKMVNITSIIDIGKDTVIFHAYSNPSYPRRLPKECIVKVHKNFLSEFKQWEKYIKDDHYFMDKLNKQSIREEFQKKAQREKENLITLQKVGVKCSRFVTIKDGILVTSFIGKNKKPAPTLKDAVLTTEEYYEAFNQVFGSIQKMYRANLIHGGLSENSILWHNKTCYIMNVGNCVESYHDDGFEMLHRDVVNLYNYFSIKNKNIFWSPGYLFYDITNCAYADKTALQIFKKQNYKIHNV